jgi:hypothetical protein
MRMAEPLSAMRVMNNQKLFMLQLSFGVIQCNL